MANRVTVLFDSSKGIIAPEIYGHFSEHIGGVFYDGAVFRGSAYLQHI